MIELIKYNLSPIGVMRGLQVPSILPGAEVVRGATKKLWVERFNGSGEVTIEGPISADLFAQLPRGSLISHTGTRDVMRIHSHLIEGDAKGDPVAKVSGSQIVSFIGGRKYRDAAIALYPDAAPAPTEKVTIGNTELNSTGSNNDAETPKIVIWRLLTDILTRSGAFNLFSIYDLLVRAVDYPLGAVQATEFAQVKKFVDSVDISSSDDMYDIVSKIMSEFDIGIQAIRNFYEPTIARDKLLFGIHGGADRTGDDGVHLKVGTDSIKKYSSLQSDKDRYNIAIVNTKYFQFRIEGPAIADGSLSMFDVAEMIVDAKHVDEGYSTIEDAQADLPQIIVRANNYAISELAKTNQEKFIVEVDISADNPEYEYRKDFNIGDIVSIDSSAFFDPQPMRVVEFVESETEGKFEAYPVLKSVKDGWKFNSHTPAQWETWLGNG